MIPKRIFFTQGIGTDITELQSFEAALRDAGIAHLNLVNVSSIFPPNCKEVSREEGLKTLSPGQITYVVMAKNSSNERNRLISSSIGVARPENKKLHGYIIEKHAFGQTKEELGLIVENFAINMLAATMGVNLENKTNLDEKHKTFKEMGNKVHTKSFTSCCVVKANDLYTTTISAAIFLLD